jgi:hypothetical protein
MQEHPPDPAPKRPVDRREGTTHELSAWVPSTSRGGRTWAVPEVGDGRVGVVQEGEEDDVGVCELGGLLLEITRLQGISAHDVGSAIDHKEAFQAE